ncbi:hypothetical protein HZB06_01560 [Candidatus Wolfebacteria bacterium]|nr:hypothetical protein [Candidatus Wolfebacteria bacterium]
MFNLIGKKIEKIRDSDEAAKKRWVIVFSAITMTIVVIIWLFYAGFAVKTTEKKDVSTDFWPIFKKGFTTVAGSLKEKIYGLILKERTIPL